MVDASILASRLIADRYTAHARHLFDEAGAGLHVLDLPDFGVTEVVNVL
jgi:hypothetical protein